MESDLRESGTNGGFGRMAGAAAYYKDGKGLDAEMTRPRDSRYRLYAPAVVVKHAEPCGTVSIGAIILDKTPKRVKALCRTDYEADTIIRPPSDNQKIVIIVRKYK